MTTIKLNDEIFKELHILKKSEWDRIGSDYKTTATFNKRIKAALLGRTANRGAIPRLPFGLIYSIY